MLARFRQQAGDRVPYMVPLSRLLAAGERVLSVLRTDTQQDVLGLANLRVDLQGQNLSFTASGGVPGWVFPTGMQFTTNLGRSFTEVIQFSITADPCLAGPPLVPPPQPPTPPPGSEVDGGTFTPDNNTGQCPVI